LEERCALQFEKYVAKILDSKPDDRGFIYPSVPWANEGCGITRAAIPGVIREVRVALDATVWFAKHGPAWGQPLPLGIKECADLIRPQGAAHLLGCYAFSLQLFHYDYRRHPGPHDYFCGCMATPSVRPMCGMTPSCRRNSRRRCFRGSAADLSGSARQSAWVAARPHDELVPASLHWLQGRRGV
jgi:hypothetical protein